MELARLGKKGQVSIPKGILRKVGLDGEASVLVDTTPDGAIILRPAAVYPVEVYDDARIAEFLAEDALPSALKKKVAARIKKA